MRIDTYARLNNSKTVVASPTVPRKEIEKKNDRTSDPAVFDFNLPIAKTKKSEKLTYSHLKKGCCVQQTKESLENHPDQKPEGARPKTKALPYRPNEEPDYVAMADLNTDGRLDADDFVVFHKCLSEGDKKMDFNKDGLLNSNDLFQYIHVFMRGADELNRRENDPPICYGQPSPSVQLQDKDTKWKNEHEAASE